LGTVSHDWLGPRLGCLPWCFHRAADALHGPEARLPALVSLPPRTSTAALWSLPPRRWWPPRARASAAVPWWAPSRPGTSTSPMHSTSPRFAPCPGFGAAFSIRVSFVGLPSRLAIEPTSFLLGFRSLFLGFRSFFEVLSPLVAFFLFFDKLFEPLRSLNRVPTTLVDVFIP